MGTYTVETILTGVGWLTAPERLAIRQILGHGSAIEYNKATKQLHLFSYVNADSMEEAIETGRNTHRAAAEATGVYQPHAARFQVLESAA